MFAERIAWLLFRYEDTFQRYQRDYFAQLYATAPPAKTPASLVEALTVYLPRRDRARLLAVFYDDYGGIHMVFSDEYVPVPGVDAAYREIRRREYGRTADVESIHVRQDKIYYPSTYGPFNLYETSIHSDGEERLRPRLAIYSWTWNHMFSLEPSLDVILKGGYREETGYEIRRGTREDAEKYAREISS